MEFLAAAGVYLALIAAALLWVFSYKLPGPGVPLKEWIVLTGVAGGAALASAAAVLALAWQRAGPRRGARFHAPVLANLIVLALCAAALEAAARIAARPDPLGVRIGGRALVPYDWTSVTRHHRVELAKAQDPGSYYVDSPALGWTLGPSRRSPDGLYLSSEEGLRSASQGERLAAPTDRPRIAIYGDSFAFSEEVPFKQSLSEHLGRRLGGSAQVLTLGVPGYGIDQAVLRFESEAPRWNAAVSVLQFIQDDIERVGGIYLFNKPAWDNPFVKPRFTLRAGELEQLPLPRPAEVFSHKSVFDLPHLDLDVEFRAGKWRDIPLSASYALRYAASLSPRDSATAVTEVNSPQTLSVKLIERFVAGARAAGSVPVVALFPERADVSGTAAPGDSTPAASIVSALARRGIQVIDTTGCMKAAGGTEQLFVHGGMHYADAGNARMAECLAPAIERHLESAPKPAASRQASRGVEETRERPSLTQERIPDGT